jgi:hypothetical protein
MATSFRSSGHFQQRDFGDSYEAFNAILQMVYKSHPQSSLVKRFQVKVAEEQKCRCKTETANWSDDSFGISMQMTSEDFENQFRKDFGRKEIRMCLGARRCSVTTMTRRLLEAPEVFVFQLNYSTATQAYPSYGSNPYSSRVSTPRNTSIPEALNLANLLPSSGLIGTYHLKGAVFMSPGHFFSAFKTSDYCWKVFNDSWVTQKSVTSFSDLQSQTRYAKPYLLFFAKDTLPSVQDRIQSPSHVVERSVTKSAQQFKPLTQYPPLLDSSADNADKMLLLAQILYKTIDILGSERRQDKMNRSSSERLPMRPTSARLDDIQSDVHLYEQVLHKIIADQPSSALEAKFTTTVLEASESNIVVSQIGCIALKSRSSDLLADIRQFFIGDHCGPGTAREHCFRRKMQKPPGFLTIYLASPSNDQALIPSFKLQDVTGDREHEGFECNLEGVLYKEGHWVGIKTSYTWAVMKDAVLDRNVHEAEFFRQVRGQSLLFYKVSSRRARY